MSLNHPGVTRKSTWPLEYLAFMNMSARSLLSGMRALMGREWPALFLPGLWADDTYALLFQGLGGETRLQYAHIFHLQPTDSRLHQY